MSTKDDPYINTRAGVPVNSATVQTGVGLGRETVLRLDRLRACYGRSRSYVADLALTKGGLDGLEAENATLIERFGVLAADAGKTWREYVENYVMVFGSKTYPPTVAQLEEMQWHRVPEKERLPRPAREVKIQVVGEEPYVTHAQPGELVEINLPHAIDGMHSVARVTAEGEEPRIMQVKPGQKVEIVPRGLRDVLGQ